MLLAVGTSPPLADYWQYFLLALNLSAAVITSSHAILWKRDSRSVLIWFALIWFVPLVGALLYFFFGINRIKRRAALIRQERQPISSRRSAQICRPETIKEQLQTSTTTTDLCAIATTLGRISDRPLLPGNRIEPLINGDQAFPLMLKAIRSAKQSISLSTYIFDDDPTGRAFAKELASAVKRGVQVRVLIDSTGARYSWPPITDLLKRLHIPFSRFLTASKLKRPLTLNLHNHRKIIVVDGKVGFTGGINIRHTNNLAANPRRPVQDLHFQVRGPVVAHLQTAFAEDWAYATKEHLSGETWFPKLRRQGKVLARGITDGPDEDMDKLIWSILAALNAATKNIWIMTPYFLPEAQIIAALNAAALRGVEVRVIVPEKNNLPFMNWAMNSTLWQLLQWDCKLYYSPAPFDHSKLMIVDDCWTMIGSSNWDARSLRLNFEFNVECYSRQLAAELTEYAHNKLATSRPITLEEINARPLPVKLRDGLMRLFSPLL